MEKKEKITGVPCWAIENASFDFDIS